MNRVVLNDPHRNLVTLLAQRIVRCRKQMLVLTAMYVVTTGTISATERLVHFLLGELGR